LGVPQAPPQEWEIVAQAVGMVSVQANCTLDEALDMINDRAAVQHCSVAEIASRVVDGVIRFGA